jgi:hypothetical protein
MCFGNQTQKEVTQVSTPDPVVKAAAQGNINFAEKLRDTGFSPYTGQQVAPFSGQQQSSFGMANTIAGAGVPNVDAAGNLINSYAGAGAGSVSPERIYENMSPYMNQYVNMALAPQMELQNQQFADQNRNLNRAATSAGAFGDARAGIESANLTTQQNIARTGLIGNAYNAAFNTAIGAGAQDTATNLQGQTTNAGLREQALGRQLGGAQALQGLGTYNVDTGTKLTNLQNTMGQQQTAQSQADLNAQYNQWLMKQQYPFQTAQLVNQSVGLERRRCRPTRPRRRQHRTTRVGRWRGIWSAPRRSSCRCCPTPGRRRTSRRWAGCTTTRRCSRSATAVIPRDGPMSA